MAAKVRSLKRQIKYHRDGSLWAKGQTLDGVLTGYREWFRKDGTKMRSGKFDKGQQIGEWTTYDKQGRVLQSDDHHTQGTAS